MLLQSPFIASRGCLGRWAGECCWRATLSCEGFPVKVVKGLHATPVLAVCMQQVFWGVGCQRASARRCVAGPAAVQLCCTIASQTRVAQGATVQRCMGRLQGLYVCVCVCHMAVNSSPVSSKQGSCGAIERSVGGRPHLLHSIALQRVSKPRVLKSARHTGAC